jgi:hypothetical protein
VAASSSGRVAFYSTFATVRCLTVDGAERWSWDVPSRVEQVEAPGLTFTITAAEPLVRALAALQDGGALALGDSRLWRLDARGGARQIGEGPDQHTPLLLDDSENLLAFVSWGVMRFFGRDGARDVHLGDRAYPQLRWSEARQLIAAFEGTNLWLFDRSGDVLAQYEFTKAINDVLWRTDGELIVAAPQPLFFHLKGPA